jgi:methylenetetrahydrofolate--tRNA-(uracil-5-)-methyltransferase
MSSRITVIGGGLAGSEAAWQLARAGLEVSLYEMRPRHSTPAHRTEHLAELVCSNSLKSNEPGTASWLLKEELRRAGSLLMQIADESAVPAGSALAVDREIFAARVTQAIEANPRIEVRREPVERISAEGIVILATGPLTSDALAEDLARLAGRSHLYFYDAISPIVDATTIDLSKVFRGSRYGKRGAASLDSDGDYLNCPMSREEYDCFVDAILAAEEVERHPFEDLAYFEACLPIEELARRGRDTLRFGPMKPVGLLGAHSRRRPYAVVQLRQENLRANSYNLVGFQNHLKFSEQKRILRMIPGLEQAEFLRFGQIHRNTYINAPALIGETLQLRQYPNVFLAGQLCGTEGYVEAFATGLMAGIHAAQCARHLPLVPPPRETAMGSLVHYISHSDPTHYQPTNIAFDLLPPLAEDARGKPLRDRKRRHQLQCERALAAFERWLEEIRLASAVRARK